MSNALSQKVLTDPPRGRLVDDCVQLIEDEVDRKGGLSGLAIKGAYKVVKTLKPGFVRKVADGLLDDFVGKLEPYYVQYLASPGGHATFGQSLAPQSTRIANDLLTVTDERAKQSDNATVLKLYHKLRPTAQDHVAAAIPGLGKVVDRYV